MHGPLWREEIDPSQALGEDSAWLSLRGAPRKQTVRRPCCGLDEGRKNVLLLLVWLSRRRVNVKSGSRYGCQAWYAFSERCSHLPSKQKQQQRRHCSLCMYLHQYRALSTEGNRRCMVGPDSGPSGQSWILIIMIAFCACTIGLVTSMSVPLSIMTLKLRPRWNKTQWDGVRARISESAGNLQKTICLHSLGVTTPVLN